MHIRRSVPLISLMLATGLGMMPSRSAALAPKPRVVIAPANPGTPETQGTPRPAGNTGNRTSAVSNPATGITGLLAGSSADLLVFERLMERRVTTSVRGIRFVTGELDGEPAVAAVCAGGKVNAALVTTALIEKFQPAEIVLTGTAGALKAAVSPGDLFVVERTGFFDFGTVGKEGLLSRPTLDTAGGEHPLFFAADRQMLAAAAAVAHEISMAKKSGAVPRIIRGALVSGDTFIASARYRDELASRTGGEAVDSEAAAVAQVCAQQHLPFLIIRGISHRSGEQSAAEHRRNGAIVAGNSARFAATVLRRWKGSRVTPAPNR